MELKNLETVSELVFCLQIMTVVIGQCLLFFMKIAKSYINISIFAKMYRCINFLFYFTLFGDICVVDDSIDQFQILDSLFQFFI